jgi:Tfp pilus assembly protein PilZ
MGTAVQIVSTTPVTQPGRSILVVGEFPDDASKRIREASAAVSIGASFLSYQDVARALEQAEPAAFLVGADATGAAQACAHVRAQARFAQVPIFGIANEPGDLAFTEIFGWGADDIVSLRRAEPLVRRLRPLVAQPPGRQGPPVSMSRMPAAAGIAIVAGSEAPWRTVMGRALYNGGFAVRFCANPDALATEAQGAGVRVVVVQEDFVPQGAPSVLKALRAQGVEVAWVVAAAPKRMAAVHADIDSVGRASVLDGFAPPENALFVVNELLSARGVDQRASARLLYGTSVVFRAAGREEDEIGFSYNISAAGVYVRTLAALEPKQDVWLEMWAPRSERRVRLSGAVAWKRPFGPRGGATVPAGFGVQIKEGLAGDLDRWRAGYEALAETLLGTGGRGA